LQLTVVASGMVAGLLSGVFGIGGGILIVPALTLWLGMDQRRAHGTSLAAVVPIAVAGVVGYAIDGHIDVEDALLLAAGSMVGALFGTRLLSFLPHRTLRIAFALLLLATAIRLFVPTPEATGQSSVDAVAGGELVLIGVATGVLAGLFGVGGGIIIVPVLILLFGATDVVAKGTSLLVIIPTALVGTASNLRRGNTDLAVAVTVGASGVIAGYIGSQVATRLSHIVSSAMFAGLLLLMSARLFRTREASRKTRRAG
jgi:uncharacterized membrane protein YfcA